MSYSDAYSTAYDSAATAVPAGPLTVLREQVAAALDTVPEVAAGEWTVMATPFDAVTPPTFMVQWGPDPWGTVQTMCADLVAVEVVVIADRLTPEANYPIVEAMVDAARAALDAARLRPYQWLAPTAFPAAEITWLAARLHITQPVPIAGGT